LSVVTSEPATSRGTQSTATTNSSPLAALSLIVALVVAGVIFIRIARRSWFGYDDWDFLAARTVGDLQGLLVPHGDHWSTIPILTYRALWQLFGLEFTAYVVVAVLLHLTIAGLLWVVMRRATVEPWIAASAAAAFAFFGSGYETTVKLFALNFGGWPIVLGLCHLLLSDHDGAWSKRDWLGLLAGLGAIASSVVGVPMVLAVGVATWMKRGLRVALWHTTPLAVVYVAWYVRFAKSGPGASPGDVLRFVQTALRGVLIDLGQSVPVALLLTIILVVGLTLTWTGRRTAGIRAVASMPLGLLAGLCGLLVLTGYPRAGSDFAGGDIARLSHYMDAAAAMILPALAFAATAVARRCRPLIPLLCAAFIIGIPGNLGALEAGLEAEGGGFARDLMLSLPRAPAARIAPPELPPEPLLAAPVTIGWLVDALDSARLPEPANVPNEKEKQQILVRLSIWQTDGMRVIEPCEWSSGPLTRDLEAWSSVSIGAHAQVYVAVRGAADWSPPVQYGQPFTTRYVVHAGQSLTATRSMQLQISSADGSEFQLCG
jgi:hypothetical protein